MEGTIFIFQMKLLPDISHSHNVKDGLLYLKHQGPFNKENGGQWPMPTSRLNTKCLVHVHSKIGINQLVVSIHFASDNQLSPDFLLVTTSCQVTLLSFFSTESRFPNFDGLDRYIFPNSTGPSPQLHKDREIPVLEGPSPLWKNMHNLHLPTIFLSLRYLLFSKEVVSFMEVSSENMKNITILVDHHAVTPLCSTLCVSVKKERSHGEEGVEDKCRKDKGHDLWYRPGPLAEFRRIPMCCLSYRSRQQ